MIIIRASDLLIQVSREFKEGKSYETVAVRPTCLQLISQLLCKNQVVILIDFPDIELTKWVNEMLVDQLKLQVDAIYALSSKFRPTEMLLDLT